MNPKLPLGMEEEEAKKYQRWLWFQLRRGKELREVTGGRWCHEDNLEAQNLGFMIVAPYTVDILARGIPQIVSLMPNTTPQQVYNWIVAMANHGDALCSKAVAYMVQQKFKHPEHRFAHEFEDEQWIFKR